MSTYYPLGDISRVRSFMGEGPEFDPFNVAGNPFCALNRSASLVGNTILLGVIESQVRYRGIARYLDEAEGEGPVIDFLRHRGA